MSYKTISFLSCCGRGMKPDLKLVKDYLASHLAEIEFHYFMMDITKGRFQCNDAVRARNDFCKTMGDVICMDGSLPEKLNEGKNKYKRILLPAPFNYQINAYLAYEKKPDRPKRNTFQGFTHIIPGSPFGKKLLERAYDLTDIRIIDDVCLPFAWDIKDVESQNIIRNKMLFYYPEIKKKKIISFLVQNEGKETLKDSVFAEFNLKKMMQDLGEEFILFTNSGKVLELAYQLPHEYNDSFIYIESNVKAFDLLYISDILITNSVRYTACYAARKRPVYCIDYKNREFGRYVKTNFPGAYLDCLEGLYEIDFKKISLKEDMAKLNQEFFYDNGRNPFEVIHENIL